MRYWFAGVPGWWWIVAFSALLILVNARSVNVFAAVEYWFAALKIAAIVIFILLAGYLLWRTPAASGAPGRLRRRSASATTRPTAASCPTACGASGWR